MKPTLALVYAIPVIATQTAKIANNVLFGKDNTTDIWPYGPFRTAGRDIVNSRNDTIVWAGLNWPLSGKFARQSL